MPATLLSLPSNIRSEILRSAGFARPSPIDMAKEHRPLHRKLVRNLPESYPYSLIHQNPAFPVQIMRTCRLLWQECVQVLYGENTFWLSVHATLFLGRLRSTTSKAIRNVILVPPPVDRSVQQPHFESERVVDLWSQLCQQLGRRIAPHRVSIEVGLVRSNCLNFVASIIASLEQELPRLFRISFSISLSHTVPRDENYWKLFRTLRSTTAKLVNSSEIQRVGSFPFMKLPYELQYKILQQTDLQHLDCFDVNVGYVQHVLGATLPKIQSTNIGPPEGVLMSRLSDFRRKYRVCCGNCITPPPPIHDLYVSHQCRCKRIINHAGAHPCTWSTSCTCQTTPTSLFTISKYFRQIALDVYCTQNQFVLCGTSRAIKSELRRIPRYLPLLRRLVLDIRRADSPGYSFNSDFQPWLELLVFLRDEATPSALDITIVLEEKDFKDLWVGLLRTDSLQGPELARNVPFECCRRLKACSKDFRRVRVLFRAIDREYRDKMTHIWRRL